MSVETIVLLITTVGGLATSGVLIYKARSDRRKLGAEADKTTADAAAVLSSSAVLLLKPMQDGMADLERRLESTTKRARELEAQLIVTQDRLIATTAELGEAQKRVHVARLRIDELETTIERLINTRGSR